MANLPLARSAAMASRSSCACAVGMSSPPTRAKTPLTRASPCARSIASSTSRSIGFCSAKTAPSPSRGAVSASPSVRLRLSTVPSETGVLALVPQIAKAIRATMIKLTKAPMTAKNPTMKRRMGGSRSAVEAVVFRVRHHVERERHPVREIEERHHVGEVEDLGVVEAGGAQRYAIGLLDRMRRHRELPGEIEHGALALAQLRHAVVERHHLPELGIAREATHGLPVRDEAVVAAVRR